MIVLCLQDGRTALHLAASYGNYEIVKILVSACANVDTTSIKVSVCLLYIGEGVRMAKPIKTLCWGGSP